MDENKKILFKKIKNIKFKLYFLYYSVLIQVEENENENNNPIFNLPLEFSEIKEIQNLNENDFLKFLYINKIVIHKILYKNDALMFINFEINEKKITPYIYLCLLIEGNIAVNYEYPFELINKLNDLQTKEKDKSLKKIIMAKIIYILIDNYKQIQNNKEGDKFDKNLKDIKDFNDDQVKSKINDNDIKKFELSKNDIKSKKLEELYLIIISKIIKEGKFNDLEKIYDIMAQIELENINISKNIYNEIAKILDEKEDYIKKYKIVEYKDIFDKEKINFYYVLICFILKDQSYIYKIPLLFKTRKNILKNIRDNIDIFCSSIKENKEIKDRIEYVLEKFIEYQYYYKISLIKNKKRNNGESLIKDMSSYKFSTPSIKLAHENQNMLPINSSSSSTKGPFSGDTYKNEKNNSHRKLDKFEDEDDFSDYSNEIPYKVLKKSSFSFYTNKKGEKPFIKYNEIKIGDKDEKVSIDEIKKSSSKNNNLNNYFLSFLEILNIIENSIEEKFRNNFKLKITLLFGTNDLDNNSLNLINCTYKLEIPKNDEIFTFIDKDILNNGLNEGLQYFLNEINNNS